MWVIVKPKGLLGDIFRGIGPRLSFRGCFLPICTRISRMVQLLLLYRDLFWGPETQQCHSNWNPDTAMSNTCQNIKWMGGQARCYLIFAIHWTQCVKDTQWCLDIHIVGRDLHSPLMQLGHNYNIPDQWISCSTYGVSTIRKIFWTYFICCNSTVLILFSGMTKNKPTSCSKWQPLGYL